MERPGIDVAEVERLLEKYAGWPDDELKGVVAAADGYTSEAVAAAVAVLWERGIDVTPADVRATAPRTGRGRCDCCGKSSEVAFLPFVAARDRGEGFGPDFARAGRRVHEPILLRLGICSPCVAAWSDFSGRLTAEAYLHQAEYAELASHGHDVIIDAAEIPRFGFSHWI
ncbi:MAG TPA: hypothetical protein VF092_29170 [Longimicrobium sp.]